MRGGGLRSSQDARRGGWRVEYLDLNDEDRVFKVNGPGRLRREGLLGGTRPPVGREARDAICRGHERVTRSETRLK